VTSQLDFFEGFLLRAARDWVARAQSLCTVLEGSEMQGFRLRLGWVHPLLRAAPCAAQLLPEIQWVWLVRFRGPDPPQAPHSPGAPPANLFKSTSRQENPLWRIRCGRRRWGGSPCLTDSKSLLHWISRFEPAAAAPEHWI